MDITERPDVKPAGFSDNKPSALYPRALHVHVEIVLILRPDLLKGFWTFDFLNSNHVSVQLLRYCLQVAYLFRRLAFPSVGVRFFKFLSFRGLDFPALIELVLAKRL